MPNEFHVHRKVDQERKGVAAHYKLETDSLYSDAAGDQVLGRLLVSKFVILTVLMKLLERGLCGCSWDI